MAFMIIPEEEKPDVPRNRIIIGGFSQGGAVALTALTREPKNAPLAGCLALSTYFPGNKPASDDKDEAKITTPVLQCHGEDDELIGMERGQLTADLVEGLVQKHTFMIFPKMGHECNGEELACIKEFIVKTIS